MPPERLTRLDFVYERWPIYFVTACTANRRPLLSNDATHNEFKKFAATGIDRAVDWTLCLNARSFSFVRHVRRRAIIAFTMGKIPQRHLIGTISEA